VSFFEVDMCFNIICQDVQFELRRRRMRTSTDAVARRRPWAVVAGLVAVIIASAGHGRAAAATFDGGPAVRPNDNTRAAGTADRDAVTVRLRAARGAWHPEGVNGPALTVEAFGEEGGPLTVPAPLIRVAEGTTIAVSVRNDLEAALRIHGLCARDGTPCPPIDVAPGHVRDIRFASGRAGTYHYWATSLGAPIPFRELAGALVVDPPDGPPAPDRIFVITEWADLTAAQLRDIVTADDIGEAFLAARPRFTFVINGLSWPATERLQYRGGELVRWRVVNLSSQTHPMHLHGFYFRVTRAGDGLRDASVNEGGGREVVTEVLQSGGTMALEWTPAREGNWLFHCHIMGHVSPARRVLADAGVASHHAGHAAMDHHATGDPSLGMAGMVLGITVSPGPAHEAGPVRVTAPRRIGMVIGADGAQGVTMGVALHEGVDPVHRPPVTAPGPALVLRRGEPVEITIENRLDEATSIHWHGLELESVYDGVHGWSGTVGRTAPMIAPGASFVVRLTPPRTGTFIYHTHLHDYRQLSSGLYGAVVVTDGDGPYDPVVDHVIVLGGRNASEASSVLEDRDSVVLNGDHAPRFVWRAGRTHRLRLINITPDDVLQVALVRAGTTAMWRPAAKDGAPLSTGPTGLVPASVRLAAGETFDVEFDAPGPGVLWLEVRTPRGKWQAQGHVVVK
jgi:FtsP/CotA-like multicopper oxidase with cupredoxin domain